MAKKRLKAEDGSGEAPAEAPGGTISKMEAVRRTLAAGVEKPQEGVEYVRREFGLEIPTPVFSSYKSQIRAKDNSSRPRSARGRVSPVGDPVELARDVKELVQRYGADAVRDMIDVLDG